MKNKALCLIGAGLAVSVMSLSASAAYILQSFEDTDLNTPNQTMEGGQAVAGTGAFSTIGVSDGSMSYGVEGQPATAGAGAKEYIAINFSAEAIAALASKPTLKWETTIPDDDNPNDSVTESSTFFTSVTSTGGYDFYGSFNRETVPYDGTTVTTSYTFNPVKLAILGAEATAPGGYVQLRFGLNSFDPAAPVAYFDNFRLVPEPASMALLGMGGLACFCRRRR